MSRETTEKEAISRFNEGLLKAVARAKQLAKAQSNNSWLAIASGLELIRVNGLKMASGKPLSRHEVLEKTEKRQAFLSKKLAADGVH